MKIYPNIRALEQSLAATSKDVKNLYNDIENLKKQGAARNIIEQKENRLKSKEALLNTQKLYRSNYKELMKGIDDIVELDSKKYDNMSFNDCLDIDKRIIAIKNQIEPFYMELYPYIKSLHTDEKVRDVLFSSSYPSEVQADLQLKAK